MVCFGHINFPKWRLCVFALYCPPPSPSAPTPPPLLLPPLFTSLQPQTGQSQMQPNKFTFTKGSIMSDHNMVNQQTHFTTSDSVSVLLYYSLKQAPQYRFWPRPRVTSMTLLISPSCLCNHWDHKWPWPVQSWQSIRYSCQTLMVEEKWFTWLHVSIFANNENKA